MSVNILTKEDLISFKEELLNDIKSLLSPTQPKPQKWLKSAEVKTLLKVSPGTLQNLRINGTLTPKKIGGTYYYDSDHINKMLSS